MKTAIISDIKINPRQREKHAPAHIAELKRAILSKGFTTPILLSSQEDGFHLVAGMGRIQAAGELWTDGHPFTFEAQSVPAGEIPYVTIADLSIADLAEAELEENILRAALSWQEETTARCLIHDLRKSQNPNQSQNATAKELAERKGTTQGGELINLHRDLTVRPHLSNPRVQAAKSLREAHRVVLDMDLARLRKDLVARGMVKTEHTVLLGDCREVMSTLPRGSFDTILCDPPYGIGADEMKKTAKHFYDDSPAAAMEVCEAIIREGFHLLKPRGNLFLFCDVDNFVRLRTYAQQQGYTAWRTPLIWNKGIDGHAPWGRTGFARTYEIYAFFTKGQKGTKELSPDVKFFKRPARDERLHAAEKPIELLVDILNNAGDPGDAILDPCCGSGPLLDAATRTKMRATCIEIDPEYHALACSRLTSEAEPTTTEEEEPTEIEELLA